jgi:hypothetical protein
MLARRGWIGCTLLAALIFPQYARGEPVVGAYYYPWYGTFEEGHTLKESLRWHLVPSQPPALGNYSSRDSKVIASHFDQSRRANISFWVVSWLGPQSAEEITFHDFILRHPRASELKYAVHYESEDRFGDPGNPNLGNLVPDFRHLAKRYFQNPNYLQIDSRPVVFMYLTRNYFNSPESRETVADLRAMMQAEFGVNPYIVGDDLGDGFVAERAFLWDAVTCFDAYGMALKTHGSTAAALAALAKAYDAVRTAIGNDQLAFIPTASPGYNDKAARDGNPALPRYMTDNPNSREGEFFARLLREVVVPRVDPRANNILMVNSFNEWHEDTQIETSIVAPPTSRDDSGKDRYSEGHAYEGYGGTYLDLLRAATVPEPKAAGAWGLAAVLAGLAAGLCLLVIAARHLRAN